jgi:hypothetical protein
MTEETQITPLQARIAEVAQYEANIALYQSILHYPQSGLKDYYNTEVQKNNTMLLPMLIFLMLNYYQNFGMPMSALRL